MQENNLIKELIKANGECVDYIILQNCIGKDGQSTIETLRTVIKKIRKKTYNEIIQNQSGMGYKVNYCYDVDILRKFKIKKYTMIDAKVLILKGNNKKNELLSYQLSKFGFKCECVNTIAYAKELLNIEKFEYVISDLNLPDGEGIDFIRSIDDLNSTKVIILSGIEDIHYKDYLYFKGIIDYIVDVEDPSYLAYTIYKTIFKIESNTRFNNILVIESSKRICEQIKDLLLPRNYNVDILNDLSQAYELIKIKSYSLVILGIDYNNSFEFLNDVKSNIEKTLPFIILSDTHRTYSTVRESYKNGASECLRKPIFAEEFILKVDQLVESTKLLQEVMIQKKILDDYKKIVDQSTIVSKTDIKGIITYANNMFCQISGYTQDELIGKNHNIIRHPSTPKETFRQMWKTIKEEGKIWNGIVKNRTKDGNDYIVQTSILPLRNPEGEIIEFIALRNDITSIYKEKK